MPLTVGGGPARLQSRPRLVQWLRRCLALGLALSVASFIAVLRTSNPLGADSWTRVFGSGVGARSSTGPENRTANRSCSRIPKILHLTFATEMVYGNYKQYLRRCLALNPDWQVYLWRDADSERFIRSNYPSFAAKFSSYKGDLQKSDAVRYAVLHRFGGVYIDMDVECIRPMFPGLQNLSAFVDRERWEQSSILFNRPMTVMNSVMGGPPGHPFFLHVLNSLQGRHGRLPVDSTGPGALTVAHADWLRSGEARTVPAVTVLASEVFSGLIDQDNPAIMNTCRSMSADFKSPATEELRKRLTSELAGFDPDRPDPTTANQRQRRRRLACVSLALNHAGQPGNGTAATIGVHRFLHLGYGFAAGKRWPTFNLLTEFSPARVRVYRDILGEDTTAPPVPMPPC